VTVATILDIAQARALEHPLDAALAIVGPAGSGKSTVLLERARRAAGAGNVWLTAARARGVAWVEQFLRAHGRLQKVYLYLF